MKTNFPVALFLQDKCKILQPNEEKLLKIQNYFKLLKMEVEQMFFVTYPVCNGLNKKLDFCSIYSIRTGV